VRKIVENRKIIMSDEVLGPIVPVWKDVENIVLLGFDIRTVQPTASRYTHCATPAKIIIITTTIIIIICLEISA
jgi:hypothetical protein